MQFKTANELAGGHSGCMMWIGSDFEYKGKNCTFTMKLNKNISFEERVDTVMTWFTHAKTPANLVMMYIEQPDGDAHKFGPDSVQVSSFIYRFQKLSRQDICVNLQCNAIASTRKRFEEDPPGLIFNIYLTLNYQTVFHLFSISSGNGKSVRSG